MGRTAAPTAAADRRIDAVRRFNRFYTRRIRVLGEGLLDSRFSLAQARVLYELANHGPTTATALGAELDLDAGYLSRILRGFENDGLVVRKPLPADARAQQLVLTARGRSAFRPLDKRSHAQVEALLEELPPARQRRLVEAMTTIEALLDASAGTTSAPPYVIREYGPGDLGWLVSRHGALYAHEYGWDATFEGFVAQIAADFGRAQDPARERFWIAERDGDNAGGVMLVRETGGIAKLRVLIVEPAARGLGIGRALVERCIAFAREAGYRKMTLWTYDVLHAARRIYVAAGFTLVRSEPHHSFGVDLVGEYWELAL